MHTTEQQTQMNQDGIRLAYAVLISLALHLLIIFEVQIGAVEKGGTPRRVIEARLVPNVATDASEVLLKAIDGPVKTQAQDVPLSAEAAPPSPAPKAADETPKPGIPAAAASPVLLDVPLPLDTTYYDAKEVDTRPSLLGETNYPERADKLGISGKVRVRLLLNENGGVDEATILSVEPAGWDFETAVLAYLKTARAKPAMLKGRTVRSTIVYVVDFTKDKSQEK